MADIANKKFLDNLSLWVSFWRENPHHFISSYLNIKKFSLFQKVVIYLMFKYPNFAFLASRGLSKSYLVALYAVTRCILYPETKVVISSKNKDQSKKVITKKVVELMGMSPNLCREILEIKKGENPSVEFKNTSTIVTVASNDGARGERANVLITDEYVLVPENVYDKVLRPFLTGARRPPFTNKPEYRDYEEPNSNILLSSACSKTEWGYDRFEMFFKGMLKKEPYFTIALPYHLGIKDHIITRDTIRQAKNEGDSISFSMEYGALFYGESADGIFHYNELQDLRVIKLPMLPLTDMEHLQHNGDIRKSKFYVKKLPNEIRVLCDDVAMMGGEGNDANSLHILSCIPSGNHYIKSLLYSESMEGYHGTELAIRVKQIFYNLECDYAAIDTNGIGLGLYDELVKVTIDPNRDCEPYPAWKAMNDVKMSDRSIFDPNAVPIIYSIKVAGGGAVEMNSAMALLTKSNIEKKTLRLLVKEKEGIDFAENYFKKKKKPLTYDEKLRLKAQYIQSTLLITEMVNLKAEFKSGRIKVTEPNKRSRKDKYSALSYGLYFINTLEAKLSSNSPDINMEEWGKVLSAEIKHNQGNHKKQLY